VFVKIRKISSTDPLASSKAPIDRSFQCQERRKSLDFDDQEIFINFKPAPVSPDARALLSRISEPTRRLLPLQKTFSDGEIRVERRELIGESGEPSYPHTCIRNQQDPWRRTVSRTPVQFSSTPEDLSLLRSLSPSQEDHHEEVRRNIAPRAPRRKKWRKEIKRLCRCRNSTRISYAGVSSGKGACRWRTLPCKVCHRTTLCFPDHSRPHPRRRPRQQVLCFD